MTKKDALVDHLLTVVNGVFAEDAAHAFSHVILADPQAHIDALVEAGVLVRVEMYRGEHPPEPAFVVIQPHKHEWRVAMDADVSLGHLKDTSVHVGTSVPVICQGCHELRWVPNRLPIEVPE